MVVLFHDYTGILWSCVTYGLFYGIMVAQVPSIVFETAGRDRYPQAMAVTNALNGVSNVISELFGGKSKFIILSYCSS